MPLRRRMALAACLLVAASLAGACSSGGERPELIVGAASSLEPLFRAIETDFEKESNIDVTYLFSASGTLTRQIEQGAPIDVFASADASFVDELTSAGLLVPNSPSIFGHGRAVIVTLVGGGDANEVLAISENVAIANPEVAPYGAAALAYLESMPSWGEVEPRLVYGGNAAQVLQFVVSGNADTGIVPLSLVVERDLGSAHVIDIAVSDEPAGTLAQTVALVAESSLLPEAVAFVEFLTGPQSQEALQLYGYDDLVGAP